MTADWILGIIGALIVASIAGAIRHYIHRREDDRKMITNLCESVAAISARQEGQNSFAKALLNQQGEIAVLNIKMDAVHSRIDDIFDIIKGVIK